MEKEKTEYQHDYDVAYNIFDNALKEQWWNVSEHLNHIKEDTKWRLLELLLAIDKSSLVLSSEDQNVIDGLESKLGVNEQIPLQQLQEQYKNDPEKLKAIDILQTALDIVWCEPTDTVWLIADGANAVISFLRSAKKLLQWDTDKAKEHIINAAISAVSLIPFADVIKILKLRRTPELAKISIKGARKLKKYAKSKKVSRIENNIIWDNISQAA